LESTPSLTGYSSSQVGSSYESWEPYQIPRFPDDLIVLEWTKIASGAHGEIRKIKVKPHEEERIVCLKLFTQQFYDAYERERSAYTMMIHRGVKRCIPYVYYRGELPRSKWDGNQPDDYNIFDSEEILYGLVMDYFEDCEPLDLRKVDIHIAELLSSTLSLIHQAGVQHNDIAERNILLVREDGTVRIVWIDFSCAWTGKVYADFRCPGDWNMFVGFLYKTLVTPRVDRRLMNRFQINFRSKNSGENFPHG